VASPPKISVKKTVNSAGSSTVNTRYCRLRPIRHSWKASRGSSHGSDRGVPARRDEEEDGVLEAGAANLQIRERAVGEQWNGRDGEVENVDGDGLAVPDGQSGDLQGGGSGHAISVFRRPRPEVVRNVAGST
jgi:hypothetical protein